MATGAEGGGLIDRAGTVEEEELLESFSLIASIDKAWCRVTPVGQAAGPKGKGAQGKASLDVTVAMSQKNLPANAMRKYLSTVHVPDPQGDLSSFHWSPFPTELTGVTLIAPSPSGGRLLVVRNGEGGAGGGGAEGAGKEGAAVKLEVWGAGRLLREVHVAATVHGGVYADGWFEGVSWNDDETSVAYVAEAPAPAKPVFGQPRQPAATLATQHPPAAPTGPARGRFGSAAAAPAPAGGAGKGKNGGAAEAGTWKGKGEWMEDWGERYAGKQRPLVFVLNTVSGVVQPVEGIPEDISAGQVVWAPAVEGVQQTVVFVGWSSFASNFNTARRLGIVYCANRPCHLFAAQVPSQDASGRKTGSSTSIVKLTAGISSAFSPRFSPDGTLLVFLSSHAAVDSGTHGATNSLHSLLWPKEGISFPHASPDPEEDSRSGPSDVPAIDIPINSIISVVARAEEQGGFPGLYADKAIANPWLADGRTLLLTTAWRSTQAIISVHVESGRVSRLTPEGPISWVLLDVRNNVVVAGASTPACPTKLMLGRVNAGWLKQEGWLWSEISPPHVEYADAVENALKSTEFEVIPILPSVSKTQGLSEGAKQAFEAIFVRRQPEVAATPPAAGGKVAPAPAAPAAPPPLLVVPHGGPHGVSTTNFVMPYAYLCALGYAVLHVNYRGSLGFGEEALQSLPKHIGRQDVSDVLEAIDRVVELGYVDASRMAVIGGSHGGFLAGHLIGQEPDRFRTAVLRNPVTNIASMVGTTDIPDWCFVEAFGQPGMAAFSDAPSAAELQAFLKASPVSHASKVKVPTLFIIGGKDLRVPSSNGLQLVHALRSQGLEARVLMMPEDVHAIDKPQSEFEQWLTVASWLKQHL
ncbi:hypothetical protein CLOM_g4369 [Closterium sp. NIES-68]|nr:hypothetical protein CLOM_g4369 [Closterium sp. NIES-68]GJP86925.1 hypothetical protein CLOP_g16891 [Closterium sp. NIES-67]